MIIGIGLSTTQLPASWLIRKLTNAKESHTWIYVDGEVYEASFGGFRRVPWAAFRKDNQIVKVYRTKTDLAAGVPLLHSWIGTKYDFDELLGGLWVLFGKWLKRKFHNPDNDGAVELDCAESVFLFLQECRYPGANNVAPCDASPRDVELLMQSNGETELLLG